MNKLSSLTIFFPAFNEADSIIKVLQNAQAVAAKITNDFEIIVVDDGSKDSTSKHVKKFQKTNPLIKLIRHPHNRGYGAALKSGIKNSTKEWVFFTDGDGQFNLDDLLKFILYSSKYRIIVGYRANRSENFTRTLNANSWRWLIKRLYGVQARDIDCAFKLFRRDTINSQNLFSEGAMLSAELFINWHRAKINFKELPVSHQPRLYGTSTGAKPRVILRAFKELFTTYRRYNPTLEQQFIRFALVGALGTALDFATLNTAYLFLHLNLYIAITIGFIVGTLNNYLLNSYWTFRHPLQLKKMTQFALIGGTGLLLNDGIVYLFVHYLNLNYNLAKLIAVAIILLWNFTLNRRWTFRSSA